MKIKDIAKFSKKVTRGWTSCLIIPFHVCACAYAAISCPGEQSEPELSGARRKF